MTPRSTRTHRTLVLLLEILVVSAIAVSAQAAALLKDVAPRPHEAPDDATLESIARSIIRGATEAGWLLVSESAGEIHVMLDVRGRHQATVAIGFDAETFRIDYVSSENLDYDPVGLSAPPETRVKAVRRRAQGEWAGPRIHGNYNVWIRRLAEHVARRIARPLPPQPGDLDRRRGGNGATPVLVADEIEKLHRLFKQGILTREEFDAQKAKLLGR